MITPMLMQTHHTTQAVFMAFVFGGAPEYPGRSLAAAHAHLVREKGLDLSHFDRVAQHFVESLTELCE